MDDLKVVLYIVVAIIWVVYNNYKKITEASKKRDISRPPDEVIKENWPAAPAKPIRREIQSPKKVVERSRSGEVRKVLERAPLPQRNPIRKPTVSTRPQTVSPSFHSFEGGSTSPSKVVHFEEQTIVADEPHPMLTAIRNMDLRFTALRCGR